MKQQTYNGLPERCYAVLRSSGQVIVIKRGETGYFPLDDEFTFRGEDFANMMNEKDGVTPAQREAMLVGSMFGWGVPGANPNLYNEDGTLNKQRVAECATAMRSFM